MYRQPEKSLLNSNTSSTCMLSSYKSSRSLSHLLMSSCYTRPGSGSPQDHMTGHHVTSGHHMREQGQPRPPRDNRPDTDMFADGLWFTPPTQPVADPVPVANLTHTLLAKIQSDKVVRWCRDGDFLRFVASCISSEPRAACLRPAS